MSFLSDKYGVPDEKVKSLIKDGIISCSWTAYEEVYSLWKQGKSARDIAAITGRSLTRIYELIHLFR